jgi:ABC-type amino acid transport substrate-binding protein
MKIKVYSRVFLLSLLCLFLCSFSVYAQDIPPDIARILHRGTLIAAILKQDLPPFHWHDDKGNLQGYDIELAKDIAQRLGVKVAFYAQSTTLDDLAQDILRGKADIILSYGLYTNRAEKIMYTKPQIIFKQVLLVNNLIVAKNQWPFNAEALLQMPHINVGTLEGSHFVDALKSKYPNINIVVYPNLEQAFEDVKNGKLFAIWYVDKLVQRWLRQHPDANLYARVLPIPKKYIPMGMAVSWQDIHFIHWLNTYIIIIETDGTLEEYKNKFFGDGNEN